MENSRYGAVFIKTLLGREKSVLKPSKMLGREKSILKPWKMLGREKSY